MMNLNELEQLANAALHIDDKFVWYASDMLVNEGICYVDDANLITACSPETILSIIGLLREMAGALNDQLNDCINFDGGKLTDCIMEQSTKTLAKYEELLK